MASKGFDKKSEMLCISPKHQMFSDLFFCSFYTQAGEIRGEILNRGKSVLFH